MDIVTAALHAWHWYLLLFDKWWFKPMTHDQKLFFAVVGLILAAALAVPLGSLIVLPIRSIGRAVGEFKNGALEEIVSAITKPKPVTKPPGRPLDTAPASAVLPPLFPQRQTYSASVGAYPVTDPDPPTSPPPEPAIGQAAVPYPAHGRTSRGRPQAAHKIPPPLDDNAPDYAIWSRINELVVYFREQAVTKGLAFNAESPGEGATMYDLRDHPAGQCAFNSAVANLPGWTSQPTPGISGRMEVYITARSWEVVSFYLDFNADGTATCQEWRLTSSRPGTTQRRQHPRNQHEVGVTVRAAHDFVEQFVLDLLDPRY